MNTYEMRNAIEISKIKVVLVALWDEQHHPEAQTYVQQFRDEDNQIMKAIDELKEKVDLDSLKYDKEMLSKGLEVYTHTEPLIKKEEVFKNV